MPDAGNWEVVGMRKSECGSGKWEGEKAEAEKVGRWEGEMKAGLKSEDRGQITEGRR